MSATLTRPAPAAKPIYDAAKDANCPRCGARNVTGGKDPIKLLFGGTLPKCMPERGGCGKEWFP